MQSSEQSEIPGFADKVRDHWGRLQFRFLEIVYLLAIITESHIYVRSLSKIKSDKKS